jgi:hypothetical protein
MHLGYFLNESTIFIPVEPFSDMVEAVAMQCFPCFPCFSCHEFKSDIFQELFEGRMKRSSPEYLSYSLHFAISRGGGIAVSGCCPCTFGYARTIRRNSFGWSSQYFSVP